MTLYEYEITATYPLNRVVEQATIKAPTPNAALHIARKYYRLPWHLQISDNPTQPIRKAA